ncbi:CUB and sushi domain-containing protein 3 [Trichonephila clavipes]|nr:CUB and sushi domain-containing protein 3 [Trichonephila clavipes]
MKALPHFHLYLSNRTYMDRSVLICFWVVLFLLCGVWKVSSQRQCPNLQKPWNGQIIGVCDRYVGAECQFECRSPYRLVGSQVRVCRSDGTWSGRTSACELDTGCNNNCGGCGRCQETTCLAVFAPENGYVDGQCNPGITGQSCIFLCNSGYAIEGGPSRLTCLPSGQWSSYTPYCRRTSGAICQFFDVPNGEADCVIDGGLTVCRVSCNPGYMLVGSSVVTCSSSGTWNEIMPSCRRKYSVKKFVDSLRKTLTQNTLNNKFKLRHLMLIQNYKVYYQ